MSKGWIKLNREIMEHWVYDDPLLFKIWVTLLLMANHKPNKIVINDNLVELQQGQFWTSIRKLSIRTNINKDTVSKKLELLQQDGMIIVDSRKGTGTLITVRNYAVYQGFSDTSKDTQSDTLADSGSANAETQTRHKQECIKNDIKNEEELRASPYPSSRGNPE